MEFYAHLATLEQLQKLPIYLTLHPIKVQPGRRSRKVLSHARMRRVRAREAKQNERRQTFRAPITTTDRREANGEGCVALESRREC